MPADLYGADLFGDLIRPTAQAVLKRRFVFPPFTVLNARDGDWQERKRAWLLIGIRSELGRGAELLPTGKNSAYGGNGFAGKRGAALAAPGGSAMPRPGKYDNEKRGIIHGSDRALGGRESIVYAPPPAGSLEHYRDGDQAPQRGAMSGDGKGLAGLVFGGFSSEFGARGTSSEASSTSVFDPVLCELAYRWFSPLNGVVLDPFAGGSVRGIIASSLQRSYVGIDLRAEQIEANRQQLGICEGPAPEWITGDSRYLAELLPPGFRSDFVFSCPPYADLERYSDDPADLSTLDYPDFVKAYREIIASAVATMADDSFACFVVGDVRGKDGNYYGFPIDTVAAFRAAGCSFYNEAILVTSVGSLPVRINAQFSSARKLGKTHQNVLVFLKGNAKRASAKCEKLGRDQVGTDQD